MSLITPQQYDALKPRQRIWLGVSTAFVTPSGETEFEVGRTSYSQKYDVYSKTLYMVGEDGKAITQGRAPWTLFKRTNGVSLGHGNMGTIIKSFRTASASDGTDKMRLAELRAQRLAAASMSFHDEMYALAKNLLAVKNQKIDALVKKTTQILLANNIRVTNTTVDTTPHYGGFAIVILELRLTNVGDAVIDRGTFRDKIDTILDHGWQVGWMGSEGQIQFEFPTR